ncbi:MAG: DNA adenine methylase [Deltaproteobacteria bacterium]|nr:DNA adenine methylase [Deltaproteobacteria bacterium]
MQRAQQIRSVSASPFLKWAGGKNQLLKDILPRLPQKIGVYYEPFIGGGALFFALASERRFQKAVIGDRNPALVDAYQTVRDDVEALMVHLRAHAAHATDADYFYQMRALDPQAMTRVERTARLLFLNKTCFNGLFRVNRRGQFNVPFGRYKNPRVLNPGLLRACSAALQGVEIVEGDFEALAERAGPNDAIYFDPPYVPLSATSSFTAYDRHPFGRTEHARLARAYRACLARGATALLSNSDCEETRKLYRGLWVETVSATRAINVVASKRGQVNEVLVVGRRRAAPALRRAGASGHAASSSRRSRGGAATSAGG